MSTPTSNIQHSKLQFTFSFNYNRIFCSVLWMWKICYCLLLFVKKKISHEFFEYVFFLKENSYFSIQHTQSFGTKLFFVKIQVKRIESKMVYKLTCFNATVSVFVQLWSFRIVKKPRVEKRRYFMDWLLFALSHWHKYLL